MTLEEAIKHAREESRKEGCYKCAAEHRKLSEWLDELRKRRKKVVYKHYGQTFNFHTNMLDIVPVITPTENPVNMHSLPKGIPEHMICGDEETIEQFAFKLDGDSDPFQSYEIDGEHYALVELSKVETEMSWKDYERKKLEKHLEMLDSMEDIPSLNTFQYHNLADRSLAWKEYPYKVYIYGCDDASYTKTFKTLDEAHIVMNLIKEDALVDGFEFIKQLGFIFTN